MLYQLTRLYILSVIIITLTINTVWGQPMGGPPGIPGVHIPFADPFQLLIHSHEVQADLALTETQISGLQNAVKEFGNKMCESKHEQRKHPEFINQTPAQMEQNLTMALVMIANELTPLQLTRLQQIMLQVEGPCLTIAEPKVKRDLEITDQQHSTIAELCRHRSIKIKEVFHEPRWYENVCTVMADNHARVEPVRNQVNTQIEALLNAAQKKRLQQMLGNKITLKPPMPPGCN